MAASLLIMVGLTGYKELMTTILPAETWYVIASLISPVGFVLQDVVADAMTVEAVQSYDSTGAPIPEAALKRMHITMQTLGRIAIIGGSALVAGVGGWLATHYVLCNHVLAVPYHSGDLRAGRHIRVVECQKAAALPMKGRDAPRKKSASFCATAECALQPNWYILGGSAVFVTVSLFLGLSTFAANKEIIFLASLAIIGYLMRQLLKDLDPARRRDIVGIAIIVFVFRAMPAIGAGASWWQIDVLKFDEAFFGTLRQVSSILAIIGMFALRGWMSRRPIPYLVVFLSVYSTLMMLPFVGMFYGLHEWTETSIRLWRPDHRHC